MNPGGSPRHEAELGQRGYYFFLSYAHSGPTSEVGLEADRSVHVFFADLTAAVEGRARQVRPLRIGFFDQKISPGEDVKARLSEALRSAEVFVPLYSPGYFTKSWPQREQDVFRRRLHSAGALHPELHILPVLWTPFLAEPPVELTSIFGIGSANPDYDENGLRALCRLSFYRDAYRAIVGQLAARIVEVAERSPLGPSGAPDIDEVSVHPTDEAGFIVAVLAPRDAPPSTDRANKSAWWDTYTGRRTPLAAEHAGMVAERLGFSCRVARFDDVAHEFATKPAIVVIDPWVISASGPDNLGKLFRRLPEWVCPLVLDTPGDTAGSDQVHELAEWVRDALMRAGAGPVSSACSMAQLSELLPALVAKMRRSYLRTASVGPFTSSSPRPPRLRTATDPEVEEQPG
jgi:hypothetical protein